jgi:hydroxyacylglutathione hydrolase
MKVERIGCCDVWRIKGVASVYLISRDGKWGLVDCGDPEDRVGLIEEVSKLTGGEGVDFVFLTHLHYDHIGALDAFGGAAVFASELELEDYLEDAERFHYYASAGVDEALRGAETLRDGDVVFGLEVLGVPGHTRGSVAFLDRERRLLFSGDTVFAGNIVGRTDLGNSVPGEMGGSVGRLRNLEKEGYKVLAGHGY